MGGFSGERSPGRKAGKMGARPEDFKDPGGFHEVAGNSLLGIRIEGKALASLSMYIFTVFVIFFIIAYALEYQKWKTLHKLMLVPYAFGTIHYYLSSDYEVFSTSSYSIWMNVINAIGIMSAVYQIFIYELTAFKYRYKVSDIREIAKDTIEITGVSTGRKMRYKPGQFAFMKVLGRKKGFPSHPFTMSQAYKPGEIQFAVKVLGSHTANLKDKLAVGDTIAVSGPFGKFNYKVGLKRQIWFAGGIGITPFRSFLQTDVPSDYNVDFYYSYRNSEEGPYVDELKAMKTKDNVRIHLVETSSEGRVGMKNIENHVSRDEKVDVFLCGPKAMKSEIAGNLKRGKFKFRDFHHEYFQFK
jgi:predicted ferric reductase